MIESEVKIQTKDQVRREKESKKRSRDRRRSWDPDFYKLGNGITEGGEEISVSEDTPVSDLLKVIQYLKDENESLKKKLRSTKEMDSEELQSVCNKNGYKTFQAYLKNVNAINAAEKGKLFSSK